MFEAKKSLNKDEELAAIKGANRTRGLCFVCPFHCVMDYYVKDGSLTRPTRVPAALRG
jgi:hypothetical protein